MRFIQCLFPRGRRVSNIIDMDTETERLAHELQDAGWTFEIECFPDSQLINMDCSDNEESLWTEICPNGPNVPGAVKKLTAKAHEIWTKRGKPKADGQRPGVSDDGPSAEDFL